MRHSRRAVQVPSFGAGWVDCDELRWPSSLKKWWVARALESRADLVTVQPCVRRFSSDVLGVLRWPWLSHQWLGPVSWWKVGPMMWAAVRPVGRTKGPRVPFGSRSLLHIWSSVLTI